ncbi:MAG TPA: MATE family efflux transporter [Gammaproteobacteria bacterium]|nr:MATE family efflux transporter [Gammaproteobacteria bacterium]
MPNSHHPLNNLLKLAIPLMLTNLVNAAASIITMLMLSNINTTALASGALITSTYGFIIMLIMSMLYSVSIMVGKMHGAQTFSEISKIVFSGNVITLLFGIPLTILLQHMDVIFSLFAQPHNVSLI